MLPDIDVKSRRIMLLDQAREPAQFAIRLAMHNAIMLVPM